MKYLAPIDPHVHLRWNEHQQPFLAYAITDASSVGLSYMIEMPNTTPSLTTIDAMMERAKCYESVEPRDCGISMHVGLTSDLKQVRNILEYSMDIFDLCSDKVYYAGSTNNGGVLDPDVQKSLWRLKARMGYKGVSIGHFEDENEFVGVFNPDIPQSHSTRQSEHAEIVQVMRQLRFATDEKFEGTFYVAHVTNPETVRLLDEEKKKRKFKIAVEATWHHLFLNWDDYERHGNRVKMNPPLRAQNSQRQLLNQLIMGYIDVVGTDHAPHPLERKDDPMNPASGIPALPFWPRGIQELHLSNMPTSLIDAVTFHNANRIFSLGLREQVVDKEYDEELWTKYGFNPFSRLG